MPLRILLVEDHAPFRRLICAELRRRADVETIEAADGLEGVQKAEELQPDLILLDINLPMLHGFEVARRIRSLVPRAKLIFLSQESSPDIVQEALRLGAHGYVHKLRAATDLMPAIEAAMAGPPTPRRHEILFCSDDAALVDGMTSFVAAALKVGDAAIVLATESHRTRLLQRLRAHEVDIDDAIERGRYLTLEADEALDPVRFLETINGVRNAAARASNPRPRVAFCGERAGRLWAQGRTAEAAQLEALCCELPHDVDILCLYPVPYDKHDQALERLCADHSGVSVS